MSPVDAFLLVFAFVVVVYGFMVFNHLVMLKHNIGKSWANIDVLLRQRHDELPKLVEACRQYMRYEQDLLDRVLQARAMIAAARMRYDVKTLGPRELQLRSQLGKLNALVESYPDLKANAGFLQLQRRISDLETAIADRREFFNGTVTANNTTIGRFPYFLFARMFGLREFDLIVFHPRRESEEPDAARAGGSRVAD